MRQAWYRMSGVDLTGIDAIGVETIQVVLTEYGPDLRCFPTETLCLACHSGASETDQRGQTGKEKEAEQRKHPRRCRAPNGGTLPTPKRDRTGGILPPRRPARGR